MSTPNEKPANLAARGEELMEMVRRGRRFTEELLGENERLRFQLVQGESERLSLQNRLESEVSTMGVENAQLRRRVEHLEKRFEEVEAENRDFALRYVQVAHENEGLAHLYVASCRLHSTLEPEDVTGIISEILVELVGAEEFAILLLDERTNELVPFHVEGPAAAYPARIAIGEGPIGRAVRDGQPAYDEQGQGDRPLAVVPLLIKGQPVGAVVISRMLKHRSGFDNVARELLGLLSGHAATALMSSRLYSATDRKLRTIEGFLDLIKGQARAGARSGAYRRGRERKMPTVLILDDSKTTQMLVMNALARIRDIRMVTALNGREALDVVGKTELDLLVTDVNMPEMDGIELIREVRKIRDAAHLPILIITAKAENQAREDGLRLGANAYVLKPLSWPELTSTAEKLLQQRVQGTRA